MRKIDWNNPVQLDRDVAAQLGVVFAMPFKERGGTIVRDYGGRRYDGTLTNGPTRALDQYGGPAIQFAAASSQCIPSGSIGTPPKFSVGAWVWKASSGVQTILAQADSGVTHAPVYLRCGNSTNSGFTYALNTFATVTSPDISLSTWHRVDMTYDGATLALYVDGSVFSTSSVAQTPEVRSEAFTIGRLGDFTGGQFWDGYIAHPLYCNIALTANQVAALYRDPFMMHWQPSPRRYFYETNPSGGGGATTSMLTLLGVG